jgi:hypothetical protein
MRSRAKRLRQQWAMAPVEAPRRTARSTLDLPAYFVQRQVGVRQQAAGT